MVRGGVVALLLTVAAVPSAGSDGRFALGLKRFAWPPPDPRTAERLADWNSPLGRTAQAVADLQARGSAPQPRPAAQAAIRVKIRPRMRLQLVTAISEGGVELAETSVASIHWPWEGGNTLEPTPSLDEQLSLLLGQRLKPR
jgi:hypothetical protein